MAPAVDRLLDALPRLALVVGKGGVGKTTAAAALAVRAARRGGPPTLLLSTDPAGTLADALGIALASAPARVAGVAGLEAFRIDAAALRADFLARWRDVLVTIVDRGTYLDVEDIGALVDAALPGADEVFGLLRLAELARDPRWARIVIDTAPTGHTLRLLALPRTFEALVALLDAMQEKHRFMVRALARRYRADAADAFLARMRAEVGELRATLTDPARTAAVVVTRAEPVVIAETERLLGALDELRIATAAIIDNAGAGASPPPRAPAGALRLAAPLLEPPPIGMDGLARWSDALCDAVPPAVAAPAVAATPTLAPAATRPPALDALVRALTIVGGKGGVGKTTVACALAVATATPDQPTLLVSTDPAPSVGDALALEVPDVETPVPGAAGLVARQMDAAAAFDRLRREYQTRVDELFEAFIGRGVDATYDRAIMRELLALAPPGIDEVYALAELGGTLAEGRYARVIVDPAPTGHLLRLLEMPALALEWSHRLMRLVLKYRDVGGLANAAEDLLTFARRTRAVDALLRDPARASLVVVLLDEPLVRSETTRLIDAARARDVPLGALLWNRARTTGTALSSAGDVPQLIAPEIDPAPVGVDALRRWAARWTPLADR